MKLAVISDVHGNVLALEAVLADIAGLGVDATINLGDHLSGPLWPSETAALLMAAALPSIRGNHDRALADNPQEGLKATDRFARERISAGELDWLRAMPATLLFEGEVLMTHGTPQKDNKNWLEQAHASGHILPRSLTKIARDADGYQHPVLLCGHSHIQRFVMLDDGRLIVNPGSVGCPAYRDSKPFPYTMSSGSPHARYAVLERRGGDWTANFRMVPYNHAAAAARALQNGREDWAAWLATGWQR